MHPLVPTGSTRKIIINAAMIHSASREFEDPLRSQALMAFARSVNHLVESTSTHSSVRSGAAAFVCDAVTVIEAFLDDIDEVEVDGARLTVVARAFLLLLVKTLKREEKGGIGLSLASFL